MAPRPLVSYSKSPENTAHRLNDRAKYDLKTVHSIINSTPIVHVSFQPPDSPFPATLPMIGIMASFDRPSAGIDEPLDLYLHGYISSRLMQAPVKAGVAAAANSSLSPAEAADEFKGLPITVSAALLDGLVLSLTPNSHSYNYRSAILFGYALPVTSSEEKLFAMERITNSVVPGRWASTRLPPTKAEMTSTQILRVRIDSASAKVREGGPHDDKCDLENEGLRGVWTGVVPVWQQFGEPVGSGYCEVGVPGYVREYIEEGNMEMKEVAMEKAVEK